MTPPSDSERAAILSQILASPEFLDSKRYRELLQYLVEKSAVTDSLKETEIAQDIFGKDASFDPTTDPLIRSYVSNLRKKLDHYYLTTEDHYSHKLEIPKGHYLVRYTAPVLGKKHTPASERRKSVYPFVVGALAIAVALLTYRELFVHPSSTAQQRIEGNLLWRDFVQPNARPTLIVLGDYFFMRERTDSGSYYRKGRINDLDEYLAYARANPEFAKRYVVNSFTFLRPSAPWGLVNLLPILQNAPGGVSVKLASQFDQDDFKTNNVVFLGSFRTLYLLKNFLHIFGLEYSTVPPSSFLLRDGLGDSVHVFRPERLSAGSFEKDFGVVARGRGPEGSMMIMLLGFSEGGVIQAAKAASNPALLKTLEEEYPSKTIDPQSLTLVIEAEGMTQSLFRATVKYVAGIGAPNRAAGTNSNDTSRRSSPTGFGR